jgi:carbon-monoxide dehydrogenase small subunit
MEKLTPIRINVNGRNYEDTIPEDLTLVDYLREFRGLMGTKKSCGQGECGACSVIVDGRLVYSCILLALQADGKTVETIEGLTPDGEKLNPIQEAFIENGAIQCGYCTPGMIMATKALLRQYPSPGEHEIREGLSGNLCRCTGYVKIMESVKRISGA